MTARLYSYKLPLKNLPWKEREGLILEWNGNWGEIAPLPGFSRESLAEAKAERGPLCVGIDPHPELLRAARNVGKPSGERCPICEAVDTVEVTYVFGARLPPGGRCPGTATELNRLRRRPEPVLCYDVEVCPECAWHHLTRKYPAGGRREGQRSGRAL